MAWYLYGLGTRNTRRKKRRGGPKANWRRAFTKEKIKIQKEVGKGGKRVDLK